MQISSTLSLFTLSAIAAASSTFSLLSIRSGSSYQYLSIGATGGNLVLTSDGVIFELKDDNSLYDTKNKKYITLSDGLYIETDTADKTFSVQNGYLTHGSDAFYACPSGKIIKLASSCDNKAGSPIALSAREITTTVTSSATKAVDPITTTIEKPTTTEVVVAESTGKVQFGVVAINSGTQFQYASIKKVAEHLHVFAVGGEAGNAVTFTLHEDGTLTDQDGVGINWDSNTGELGDVSPWGTEKPASGFSIEDGNLVLNGKNNWKACPSGENVFSLANNDCTGGTGIALHVVDQKNV